MSVLSDLYLLPVVKSMKTKEHQCIDPACRAYGKSEVLEKPRALHKSLVKHLEVIYHLTATQQCTPEGWVHCPSVEALQRGRIHPRLRHWGLIEAKSKRTSTTNSEGMYRITWDGVQFMEGAICVPKKLLSAEGKDKILARGSRDVYAYELLGYHFDYKNLMEGGGGASKTEIK